MTQDPHHPQSWGLFPKSGDEPLNKDKLPAIFVHYCPSGKSFTVSFTEVVPFTEVSPSIPDEEMGNGEIMHRGLCQADKLEYAQKASYREGDFLNCELTTDT